MRSIRLGLAICFIVTLIGCRKTKSTEETQPVADAGLGNKEKPGNDAGYKDKIIGTWEFVKDSSGGLPAGTTNEYKKDGKFTITQIVQSQRPDGTTFARPATTAEGTYTIEGDVMKVTLRSGGKEFSGSLKIQRLTDTQLVVSDITPGQTASTVEYRKK